MLVIRKAHLDGRDGLWDVAIADAAIIDVAREFTGESDVELDAAGRLVAPALVECHIHLDKTGVLPELSERGDGSLNAAIALMHEAKRTATPEGIRAHAGELIERMVIAGTTRIRTHVDLDLAAGLKTLEGVEAARGDYADVCEIEIVAFPQRGLADDERIQQMMRSAMEAGASVVGGIPAQEADHEQAAKQIEFCMALAQEFDADLDMHIDETDDPYWHTLELLIDAAEQHGWGGRTSAAHCCSMAAWDDDYAARQIARAAEVGVNVITNPATNLMIQGRDDAEPKRRGIARVRELLAAGVNVAAGQDNLYDGFYPFGSGDQMMIAWLLAHAAHLSTPEEIRLAFDAVGASAARVMRIDDYVVEAGARADLVVFDAESIEDALRLQSPRRWVLHDGRVVAETNREAALIRSD